MSEASGPRPVVGEGAIRSSFAGGRLRKEVETGVGASEDVEAGVPVGTGLMVVICAVPVGVGASGGGAGAVKSMEFVAEEEPFASRAFCSAGLYCRRRVRAERKTCWMGLR